MTNPSAFTDPADGSSAVARREKACIALFLSLIVLPQLLLSTEPYLAYLRLGALALIAVIGGREFRCTDPQARTVWKIVATAWLVIQFASIVGGLHAGAPFSKVLLSSLSATVAITGMLVLCSILLRRRWRRFVGRLIILLLLFLLVPSLIGFFFPLDRYIAIGGNTIYFEPMRLALIWPSRLAMYWYGQIGWEHANHAGLVFGLGFLLILEFIARHPGKSRWYWWLIAISCACAVFLTGSRSAWLMILATLPWLAFRRPLQTNVKFAAAGIAALVLGIGALHLKESLMRVPQLASTTPAAPVDLHTTGLIQRGSSGRFSFYPILWKELENHRTFGRGLAATGKPFGYLMHEHSIYLATLRGGGFVALAAHLVMLAAAAFAAWKISLYGLRWPLVLLIAVTTSSLFDRSSVFKVTGTYEFLFHGIAILVPILILAQHRRIPRRVQPYSSPTPEARG